MPHVVDFKSVSTVGVESSPVAEALAGLRANEARYFHNKYDIDFTTEPAEGTEAFTTADALEDRWLADLLAADLPDRRPTWLRRQWRATDRAAGLAGSVPLAMFGALHLLLAFDPTGTLTGQAVLAVMLGAPALMGAFAALANGRVGALIGLPEYVVFRLLRSYLTLESVLSIAAAPPRKSDR